MSKYVEHIGKVISSADSVVRVEIESKGMCASCSMKSCCGMSGSKIKIVDIRTASFRDYRNDDKVRVSVGKGVGLWAVLWAYVVPFVILIAAVVISDLCGLSEGLVIVVGLASVAVCYFAIFKFRNKIENKVSFKISKY